MFQIRIHGRGGQGVVTAAEMMSIAAFGEGHWSQAFPSFGSERMGAPVSAFCRIDDREIRSREPVLAPDAIIIQDPTLLHQVNVFEGLSPDGYLLINSSRPLVELGIDEILTSLPAGHAIAVPATEIAVHCVKRPVPNVPMLAAFCVVTGRLRLESVESAIRQKFPEEIALRNIEAALQASSFVNRWMSAHEEVHHA